MEILSMIALFMSFAILNVDTASNFPPPLSKKKEQELFVLARDGDSHARNELIEHNLRLVAHIVRKYYSQNEMSDDLISVGTIGLIKAVDSFDISKGAGFATYSAKCIQNEILMFFRSKKKTQNDVSINETIDTDRDGNPLTYMDIIRVEDTIAEDIHRKMRTGRALKLVDSLLSDREKDVIIMRYGLNGKKAKTQRETAEILNISRSYVSRIEKTALSKIYEKLKND